MAKPCLRNMPLTETVSVSLGDEHTCWMNSNNNTQNIARQKNMVDPNGVIGNWMRNRNTIEYLGLWETLHNPNFNPLEFEEFRKEAGLNAFTLSPTRWIEATNAIGLVAKSGRYGTLGTEVFKERFAYTCAYTYA